MSDWFYAKDGAQQGPVSLEFIKVMIREGNLNPAEDLVWNSTMDTWTLANYVPELSGEIPTLPSHPADHADSNGPLMEIAPGSDPLDAIACLKRAWDLTIRHIGLLILVALTCLGLSLITEYGLGKLDGAMGWQTATNPFLEIEGAENFIALGEMQSGLSSLSQIISFVINTFILLGATVITLKITMGKTFAWADLFTGAPFLLKAIGATILLYLGTFLGIILLIVPGVYFACRFGFCRHAIVDKNLGVFESFRYSAALTKGNVLQILILAILSVAVFVAGCAVVLVGLLFAFPMISIMWTVAFRWMQYGRKAVLDDPLTGQSLIFSLETRNSSNNS